MSELYKYSALKSGKAIIFLGLSLTLFISSLYATPFIRSRDGTVVDTVFEVEYQGKRITCGGPINNSYLPGTAKALSNATLFTTLKDNLKKAQAKVKNAKNSTAKAKAKKNVNAIKAKIKTQGPICAAGPGGTPPAAPPQPTNAPTSPTATPTPRPEGNFDVNGNVTSAGKIKFGIPSNLSASREAGRTQWSVSCNGCHEEKIGSSFSYYKTAIQASPMFIFNLTDTQLANLTAYLRRFETN